MNSELPVPHGEFSIEKPRPAGVENGSGSTAATRGSSPGSGLASAGIVPRPEQHQPIRRVPVDDRHHPAVLGVAQQRRRRPAAGALVPAEHAEQLEPGLVPPPLRGLGPPRVVRHVPDDLGRRIHPTAPWSSAGRSPDTPPRWRRWGTCCGRTRRRGSRVRSSVAEGLHRALPARRHRHQPPRVGEQQHVAGAAAGARRQRRERLRPARNFRGERVARLLLDRPLRPARRGLSRNTRSVRCLGSSTAKRLPASIRQFQCRSGSRSIRCLSTSSKRGPSTTTLVTCVSVPPQSGTAPSCVRLPHDRPRRGARPPGCFSTCTSTVVPRLRPPAAACTRVAAASRWKIGHTESARPTAGSGDGVAPRTGTRRAGGSRPSRKP